MKFKFSEEIEPDSIENQHLKFCGFNQILT